MKKITFTIVGVLILIGIYFVVMKLSSKTVEQVACTQEAKICPDGSSVGRSGPNCEFAMCPTETQATTTKTVVDKTLGISYSYKDNFYLDNNLTNYIHPVEWPPKFAVATSSFVCKTSGDKILADGKTELKTINGNKYCLTTQAEGAAGSTYTTYTYKRQYDKRTIALSFITRVPQCANYDEPKQSECKVEIANFSIDNLVDSIFKSVIFN